ncbi:MAG: hypothetical protein QM568_12280, partial [Microbacterium sp.]
MTDTNYKPIAIKGFDKNMKCNGFQFEEGKTYDHGRPAVLCREGFHYVTQPIDVFWYKAPAESLYHIVEVEESTGPQPGGDSKEAARVMRVGARIELPALIKAQIDFVFANVKKSKVKSKNTTEPNSLATNSGDYGASTNSGHGGASTNSGQYGASTNSGNYGASTNSGHGGASTNSGHGGASTNSGHYGASTNSGDYGAS